MRSEWKEKQLGDVCEITSSKRIFAKEYRSVGIPFYRGKEIIEKQKGNQISTELYIEPARYEEISQKHGAPKSGDILLTSVGTLGIPYVVQQHEEFYFKDGNLTWFRNFNGADSVFIYYWLLSPWGRAQIDSKCIGSTQKALTIETLLRFDIALPSIPEQCAIAATLSCLDDKIELNNKINANLEAQAQAIFKSWFVDFEPWDGVMPVDWSSGSLLDIADYLNGLAMQKFRPSDGEIGLPVLKIKELRQGCCDSSSELCSPNIRPDYIVHNGDVIFSWSGSLLVDVWCGGKCGLNQHLFKVTSAKYDKWFYYMWTCHHLDQFIAMAADKATTMGHIKREALANAIVLIPSQEDYAVISDLLAPKYELIINNRVENRTLAAIRDALLPKLMSGEIEVPVAE